MLLRSLKLTFGAFLLINMCVVMLSFGAGQANAQAKGENMYWVKFNEDQNHPDVKLAKALLRNVIDFQGAQPISTAEPKLYAKHIKFKDGKEMIFTRFFSRKSCAFRGCAGYVVVKNGEDAKWQLAVNGPILDYYYIDTRKQKTEFPALVTETEGVEGIQYWLWRGDRYRMVR